MTPRTLLADWRAAQSVDARDRAETERAADLAIAAGDSAKAAMLHRKYRARRMQVAHAATALEYAVERLTGKRVDAHTIAALLDVADAPISSPA